jgi:hypothetical protein
VNDERRVAGSVEVGDGRAFEQVPFRRVERPAASTTAIVELAAQERQRREAERGGEERQRKPIDFDVGTVGVGSRRRRPERGPLGVDLIVDVSDGPQGAACNALKVYDPPMGR